ncbi:hypothetical protein [Burkholderia gladioli]|uniref:hypothetical protein n=1 Tax=Burkholderia gladioli TaxID=28095 RepID=UPI000BF1CF26|nr:hypothetical protein [Burkholderia gladioli]PEH80799.1 hypothetical protein CRM95_21490 [Burkholderia gladioli]
MSMIDFILDEHTFRPLWRRAVSETTSLRTQRRETMLYFESSDLRTSIFFELIQHLLKIKGDSSFWTIILDPDPFNYFHENFKKFPGFVHNSHNTENDFFEILNRDPGGNPADSLADNGQQYVVMPEQGEWIIFGDRSWDTGVLSGQPDIMKAAQSNYRFFIEPVEDFRIEPYCSPAND